jgi:hypothetical protein
MAFSLDNYVDVPTRLRAALDKFPELSIQETAPKIVEMPDGKTFLEVTTTVYRAPGDPQPVIVSCWEEYPGTTPYTRGAEQQNASTSGLGRALGMLGFGIKTSIASREDVERRQPQRGEVIEEKTIPGKNGAEPIKMTRVSNGIALMVGDASPKQLGMIRALGKGRGLVTNASLIAEMSRITGRTIENMDQLSKREASTVIEQWKAEESPRLAEEAPF